MNYPQALIDRLFPTEKAYTGQTDKLLDFLLGCGINFALRIVVGTAKQPFLFADNLFAAILFWLPVQL